MNCCTTWKAELFTIGVGARGFVATSVSRFLKTLGFKPQLITKVCKALSLVVAKGPYAIRIKHEIDSWEYSTKKDDLIKVEV